MIPSNPLWTALVTPLMPDLTIDYKSLDGLLEAQEQAQNGLLILGSTGEALNLGLDDKKRIVERCIERVTTIPTMVGVGGHDLKACLSWLDFLETLPISAYLMVTPIYAKPQAQGQYRWFKELFDRSQKPIMLYNIPSRAGVELSISAVERLREHQNYWAIKDSSGSLDKFKEYLDASKGKPVYCGDDILFPKFAQAKSSGLVSVAANAWPLETRLYVDQCQKKTFSAQVLWEDALRALSFSSNPIPIKRLLYEEKHISHNTMMPPLSELDFRDCSMLLMLSKQIRSWYQNEMGSGS